MNSTALLALLMPALPADMPAIAQSASQDQTVQVWLNRRSDLEFGDRIRVYVKTADDGHVVVLHADTEGRIRVLFPLDPFADDFVRGGRDYEIRDRNDRPAVRAVEAAGFGTVFVAYSPDPFHYDEFSRGDHWDYEAFSDIEVTGDAERELTEVAQRMAGATRSVYELETYYLNPPVAFSNAYDHYGVGHHDHVHYGTGARFSFNIGFYSRYGYYRSPFYSRRSGLFFGAGYYDPFYYDPFYYDPFYYDPFYYRPYSRSSFYFGYRGGYGYRYVYTSAGRSVNYDYTFRNRTVAGIGYRDRRRTPVGTLATARRSRQTVARAQPRRASSLVGRRTATRGGVTATAPERRTVPVSANRRRTVGGGERAALGSTTAGRTSGATRRITPARRPAAGSVAQPSRRRSVSTRGVPEYRVAPTARRQPSPRSQPERRSATSAARVGSPRSQPAVQSGTRASRTTTSARRATAVRNSTARTTTRISTRSAATPSSRGQLQRRSPSRSRAITPSRSAGRTGTSRAIRTAQPSRTATSARTARRAGPTRIARPGANTSTRSTGAPRAGGARAAVRRSPSRTSRANTSRRSVRRRSN